MKKKIKSMTALFLCVSALCLFCACAAPSGEDHGSNESDALATKESDNPTPVTEQPPAAADGEGSLGDYYIKIVSAAKAKDYSGADVLIVTYEWTNNADDAAMFSTAFTAKAYQNGVECTTAYMVDGVFIRKIPRNRKNRGENHRGAERSHAFAHWCSARRCSAAARRWRFTG